MNTVLENVVVVLVVGYTIILFTATIFVFVLLFKTITEKRKKKLERRK